MNASTWAALLVTFWVAVMSPGPDFLATLRMSLSRGRRYGIGTGLGIGTGTSLWAVGTMVGIVAIISAHPTVFLFVRLAGATFLAFYGARILYSVWKAHKAKHAGGRSGVGDSRVGNSEVSGSGTGDASGAGDSGVSGSGTGDESGTSGDPAIGQIKHESNEDYPWWKAFRLGFLTTTVGNPKAVIFFTSLFATMLPPHMTLADGALLTVLMVLISSTWFTIVASVASIPAFIRGYEKLQTPIDVLLGCLFIVLGLALIPWSALFG